MAKICPFSGDCRLCDFNKADGCHLPELKDFTMQGIVLSEHDHYLAIKVRGRLLVNDATMRPLVFFTERDAKLFITTFGGHWQDEGIAITDCTEKEAPLAVLATLSRNEV